MKMEGAVAEVMEIINGVREEPHNLFAMIRDNVQETGRHLDFQEPDIASFVVATYCCIQRYTCRIY